MSHSSGPEQTPARSAYHDRLPYGERLSVQPLVESRFFAFEGTTSMAPLEPMLVPETPREGEDGPEDCFFCGPGAERVIWQDDLWQVGRSETFGLPFVAGLAPRAHLRLDELSGELLTSFGPMVQRLAGAISSLDSVARTHIHRLGDGAAHFHLHFLARPLGMQQGRGPILSFWDDVLPPLPPDLVEEHTRHVVAALSR
jgi:diadenosine tetraphosphate (Ap4A) HIT family hydrolase